MTFQFLPFYPFILFYFLCIISNMFFWLNYAQKNLCNVGRNVLVKFIILWKGINVCSSLKYSFFFCFVFFFCMEIVELLLPFPCSYTPFFLNNFSFSFQTFVKPIVLLLFWSATFEALLTSLSLFLYPWMMSSE